MLWVGLTGSIASGKSTVAARLRQKSVPVIDADQLAHQALALHKDEVSRLFGAHLINQEGEVDRKGLGREVFADPSRLRVLEALLHPWIQAEVRKQRERLAQQGFKLAVYDVPLLFEKGLEKNFDLVLLVYAPKDLCLQRLMSRNGLSQSEAEQRLSHQLDIELKRQRADVVLNNTSSREALDQQVDQWLTSVQGK